MTRIPRFQALLTPLKKWGAAAAALIPLLFLDLNHPAGAVTSNEVNTAFNAYKSAFYVTSGTNAWFANDQTSGSNPANATYFWGQAEEIETIIDAYEWTSNSSYLGMISNLLNGFIKNNGTIWTYDSYNDDILWACMAFARGAADTGNTNFYTLAKTNFDAVYARAWSTNLGGGLYWQYPENASKNACVSGPGAIAAYLLYQYYGGTNYYYECTN